MQKRILLFILFLITISSFSQIPVWQGFEMNWTYNHRINRLGSYIYQDSVYNTAATGIGRDSGQFKTHYLLLPDSNCAYQEFEIYRQIEAKENEMIQIQIDTLIPVSYHHSIFYLNGFDLIANNDADKLQLMDFSVKMVKGNNDSTYLRIGISLIFNCQSLECDWINNEVEYDLHLYIGSITWKSQDYISYTKMNILEEQIVWDKKSGGSIVNSTTDFDGPRFYTDIHLSLNKAHWYAGLGLFTKHSYSTTMYFHQYRMNMKKNAYYKPHANFSKKAKGNAKYEIEGILLTRPAEIPSTYQVFDGSIIWKGNNRSAFGREAIRSKSIR